MIQKKNEQKKQKIVDNQKSPEGKKQYVNFRTQRKDNGLDNERVL